MLPLFILAHFGHHLLTALPGPLLPFIRNEFKLDYTRSAFITSAFSLSYGFGQLPAGWLADRIGRRILITIAILGVAAAGLLVGFSQNFIMLIACLVIMGLVGGGYHPSSSPLISVSVPPNQRGRALGFHLIGGSASFFVAPIIGGLIAGAWSWRGSFISLAIPSAILGVLFFILLGRRSKSDAAEGITMRRTYDETPPPGNWRRIIALLTNSIIGFGMTGSALSFLSLYMVDSFHIAPERAASLQAIINSAGLWVGPIGGWVSDRIGRIPIILGSSLLSGVFIFLLRIVPFGWPFYALLLFMGINNYLRMPTTEAFIMGQTPSRHRSTIYGIYYLAGQEAGAIFSMFITGPIIDRAGFSFVFGIASGVSIVMTIITSIFIWDGDRVYQTASRT